MSSQGKHPGGRPTALTPELQANIIKFYSTGCTIETAAAAAGVQSRTIRNWLRRGRDELNRLEANPKARARRSESPYVEFLDAMEEASAKAVVLHLNRINTAAKTVWTAAAWWLERRLPDQFGRRLGLEASGPGGGPIKAQVEDSRLDLKSLTAEEMEAIRSITEKLVVAGG